MWIWHIYVQSLNYMCLTVFFFSSKSFRVTIQLKIQQHAVPDVCQLRTSQAFARSRTSVSHQSRWKIRAHNVHQINHSNILDVLVFANQLFLLCQVAACSHRHAHVVNRHVLSNTMSPWHVTTAILSSSTSTNSRAVSARSRNAAPTTILPVSRLSALVELKREASVLSSIIWMIRRPWTRRVKNDTDVTYSTILLCCTLTRRNARNPDRTSFCQITLLFFK